MRNRAVLGLIALLTATAQAQPPQGPGGPGGPPPLSAALAPTDLLSSYLRLTPEQGKKLRALQEELQRSRPRPPQPGASLPSPEELQKHRKAMDASFTRANKKLEALLTAPQKAQLKTLLKALETLQKQHIPPFALQEIQLTRAQLDKLATGKDALTAAQRKQLDAARPPFDGPGGPPPGG